MITTTVFVVLTLACFTANAEMMGKMHLSPTDVCCGDNLKNKSFEIMKDQMKECVDEILGEKPPEMPHNPPTEEEKKEMHEKFICMEECVAKKVQWFDDSRNINSEKLIESIAEIGKESHFEENIESTVEKCSEKANAIEDNEEGKCSKKPVTMWRCIAYEILSTCPPDEIKDKEKCDKLLEKLSDDKFDFSPPPPPPSTQ